MEDPKESEGCSRVETRCREIMARPDEPSLVTSLTDCLNFSPAFTLTGFETVNDKLLREMNERAKRQLQTKQPLTPKLPVARSRPLPGRPSSGTPLEFAHNDQSKHAPLQKPFALYGSSSANSSMICREPVRRNTPVGSRDSVKPPISLSSLPKRTGSGLESPSKRLRGAPNRAPSSPTSSLSQLSLDEKDRLAKVSAARQQARRVNASPRCRQLQRAGESSDRASMSLNARPLPSLRLDPQRPIRAKEPVSKKARGPQTPTLMRSEEKRSSQPTSGSFRSVSQGHNKKPALAHPVPVRSVSAAETNAQLNHAATDYDSLPSYARPTKATLRRSQSTVPLPQNGALSQQLRHSSSTRSISRLLN